MSSAYRTKRTTCTARIIPKPRDTVPGFEIPNLQTPARKTYTRNINIYYTYIHTYILTIFHFLCALECGRATSKKGNTRAHSAKYFICFSSPFTRATLVAMLLHMQPAHECAECTRNHMLCTRARVLNPEIRSNVIVARKRHRTIVADVEFHICALERNVVIIFFDCVISLLAPV